MEINIEKTNAMTIATIEKNKFKKSLKSCNYLDTIIEETEKYVEKYIIEQEKQEEYIGNALRKGDC